MSGKSSDGNPRATGSTGSGSSGSSARIGGMQVQVQNRDGQWVPAIPVPYHVWWQKRCECKAAFWTMTGYQGHYALTHILKLGPGR